MAFHGLSRAQAEQLSLHDFGARMHPSNPALAVAHAGRVVRYLGDFRALVRTPGQRVDAISSTMPLRAAAGGGPKRPVDLQLRPAGNSFVALNPLERVSISKRLGGGVIVGPDGIRVVPEGVDGVGTVVAGESVYFGGVGPDEDVSIAPRIKGAEVSTMLRSRLSPEQIEYRLTLPAGASMAEQAGGVVITRAGQTLARVPAPSAIDAQNSFVPVRLRVVGDQLVLSVAHRSLDVAYPILVDPRVVTYLVKRSTPGWGFLSCEDQVSGGGPAEGGTCEGTSRGGPTISATEPGVAREPGVLTAPAGDYGFGEIQEWSPGEKDCNERKAVKPGLIYCESVYSEPWYRPYAEWYWSGPGKKRWSPKLREVTFQGVSVTPGESSNEKRQEEGHYGTGWWRYSVGCYDSSNLNEAPPTTITTKGGGNNCLTTISLGLQQPPLQFVYWGPPGPYAEGGKFSTRVAPATGATTLSVEDAVLVEERSPHRRRGIRRGELLGLDNPGYLNRHDPCATGDPVNCATGDLTEAQTDLSVPGRGVGLTLARSYNSQAAAGQTSPGPFGYGWSWSFGASLKTSSSYGENVYKEIDTVEQANGSTVVFTTTEGRTTTQPGVEATLHHDQEHGTYLYTLPNQESLRFASGGRLVSDSDRNGNVTAVNEACEGGGGGTSASVRNAGFTGRPRARYADYVAVAGEGSGPRICHIEVIDPAGRKLTLYKNAEGLAEKATDPMGHTVTYGYEGGNLVSVTEPGESAPRWRFHYDAQHRMTAMIDGRGATTTDTYDAQNRVTEQTDPRGDTRHFEYGEEGGQALEGALAVGAETREEETSPEVSEEEEEIVGSGVLAPEPGERPPATSVPTTFITKITDGASGEVTREQFNSGYEVASITNGVGTPRASTTTLEYDANGHTTGETDANGHKTLYSYDANGNKTSETNAVGSKTQWAYDSNHDVIESTTPKGEATTIKRDAHGNATEVLRPAPGGETQTTKYAYDAFGELTGTTDPLNRAWKYEYDSDGDRIAEIDPQGGKRTFTFNEASQETSTTSPRGNAPGAEPARYTTVIERDAQGRVVRVIEPLE